jgi:polar amino acid transport system permease protein
MAAGFLLGWLRSIRSVPIKKVIRDFRTLADARSEAKGVTMVYLAATIGWTGTKYLGRRVGDAYVEIIRGTPLFVQILFAWSILVVNFPGIFASPTSVAFTAGLVALTANTAGYQAEIFRAGLQTVHSGQVEAARALGFTRLGAMRHIVLPQALRLIVPPLTNEYIGLFKASTLLFILGVTNEITFVANREAFSGHVFEIFAMITAIFLLITVVLAKVVQSLEARFRIPGLGIQQTRRDRPRPPAAVGPKAPAF